MGTAHAGSAPVSFVAGSLTWVDRPVDSGAHVRPRSAHGRPAPFTVLHQGETASSRFVEAQRPVAAGQTVALYDPGDAESVLGAGIAA